MTLRLADLPDSSVQYSEADVADSGNKRPEEISRKGTWLPNTVSASSLLQVLTGAALILSSFVLPMRFPAFQGTGKQALIIGGGLVMLVGLFRTFFGDTLRRSSPRGESRSRVTLPREGMLFLGIVTVIAAASLIGQSNRLLLVFALLFSPFLVNGQLAFLMLRRIRVGRRVPDDALAGEPFDVDIGFTNKRRFLSSRMLTIQDQIRGPEDRAEGSVLMIHVPPGQSRWARYRVLPERRGRYRFGPLRVSCRFPIGILERARMFTETSELVVFPRLGRLSNAWKRQQQELSESLDRSHSRRGLFDDEFHCIREFRDGDNPRSIHWRTTARRGEFMVKEFEQNRDADVSVILDLCLGQGVTAAEFELAISFAASIITDHTSGVLGGRYLMMVNGKEPHLVESQSAVRFRHDAMHALALCEPAKSASMDPIVGAVLRNQDAGRRHLVITPRSLVLAEAIEQAGDRQRLPAARIMGNITFQPADPASLNRIFTVYPDSITVSSNGKSYAGTADGHSPSRVEVTG